MKKILLCTFMLCCCISYLFADSWTDENGVTWYYSITYETQEAQISGAEGFGDILTIPEKITYFHAGEEREAKVTSIHGYNNIQGSNIVEVTLPSTVTYIGEETFYNCSSLTQINGLSNCYRIGRRAFDSCKSLVSIDLTNCTYVGDLAFQCCSSLTDVGDLSACVYIGHSAFYNCSSLVNSGKLTACTEVQMGAFSGCSSLKSIDLPNCESIGNSAFLECHSLEAVTNLTKCKQIDASAFMRCHSLTDIGELPVCKSVGNAAFQECISLASIPNMPECEIIERYAFSQCSSLETVGNLPKCKTIGEYAFQCYEFYDFEKEIYVTCKSTLKSIGNLSACTLIDNYAFSGCSMLTNIGNLPACTTIGNSAFMNCSSLTSIGELPVCTKVKDNAFSNCKLLTNIPNLSACTSIGGYVFSSCTSLKTVDLEDYQQIPNGMFANCTSLISLGNLSECTTIGDYALSNCTSLTTIGDLPNCTTIGLAAFSGCTSLAGIGNLSACTTIGNYAFASTEGTSACYSLKSIGDLSACTSIGVNAFMGCDVLKSITFPSTPPALGNVRSLGEFPVLRVPEKEIDAYKAANIWSDPSIKNRIISSNSPIDYVVTNTALNTGTPGLAKEIAEEDMLKVVTLKVSGTINSYDIIAMNNWMPNLRWLDLTDATIEACDYEYYTGEKTTDNVIGNCMFKDQDEYVSIKLPKNVVNIGNEAFFSCSNLKEVVMHKGVTSIGENTFGGCGNLSEILIPEGCERIGYYAFQHCSKLNSVAFPTSLKSIDNHAFESCSSLTKISLPEQLNSIGYGAFSRCSNLEELRIPSSVMYIGNEAFNYCDKLKDVYTYTIEPTTIIQETFSNYQTATLHVPYTSRAIYRINTEWSQFLNSGEFDIIKEPYEYFYINKDFMLDDQTGVIEGKPDADFNPGSGFIQDSEEDQEMGDIHIKDDGNSSDSIIGDGNIDADNLFFDMTIEGGRWYFFCFPFKVYLSDITCPGQHVWRKYDGAKRAEKGEGGWVDLDANEDHLKKGYGYIFQASQSGTLTLKVKKEQFGKFENADHHHTVEEHPAQDENNASWNFMGNPHTSYYGIGEMGYDAPITIWTGTTYEAVRPGDDDYYLKPFQAFFVQKPEGTDVIAFDGDNRMTYLQSEQAQKEAKARRMARGINPDRLLVNLTLSDGTHTDKTRVVFNDKQSIGYEMACDAAKFMSTEGTPQLYTLDNKHIRYAINERPNGDVTMGYSVSKEGTYTISVARMDKPMVLRDLEMGITFDLSNGDYTFTSKVGTNEKRFVLSANKGETGIADIMKETGVNIMAVEGGIHISGLNGQTVYIYDLSGAAIATQTTDGTAAVKAGTYVIKVDSLSTKLLVK